MCMRLRPNYLRSLIPPVCNLRRRFAWLSIKTGDGYPGKFWCYTDFPESPLWLPGNLTVMPSETVTERSCPSGKHTDKMCSSVSQGTSSCIPFNFKPTYTVPLCLFAL